jgi:hypothetical protein
MKAVVDEKAVVEEKTVLVVNDDGGVVSTGKTG